MQSLGKMHNSSFKDTTEGGLGVVSGGWEALGTGKEGVGALGMSAKNLEVYAKVCLIMLTYDTLNHVQFR